MFGTSAASCKQTHEHCSVTFTVAVHSEEQIMQSQFTPFKIYYIVARCRRSYTRIDSEHTHADFKVE